MDIIEHTIKNSDRKSGNVKREEEMLTPVLSIVEEDDSLGNDEQEVEIPSSLLESNLDTDHNNEEEEVQYEFNEAAAVTYRVMQVSTEGVETITASLDDDSPVSGAANSTAVESTQPVQTVYNYPINGGIYVIGTPQKNPFTGARAVISRVSEEGQRTLCRRDDKRRATHNEVERRRRDKINNWIMKLGKIIPDCKQESSKGNFEAQSKGGILAKACDYIIELRETNTRLLGFAKENEQLFVEVEQLSKQIEELRRENESLKAQLRRQQQPS